MYTLHSTVALAPKLSHRSQTDIIRVWSWTTTEKSSENSKTKKKTAKMRTKLQTEEVNLDMNLWHLVMMLQGQHVDVNDLGHQQRSKQIVQTENFGRNRPVPR